MEAKMDKGITIGQAAAIAGIAVLLMAVTVPLVEFHIFPTLVDVYDAKRTTTNIDAHPRLFTAAFIIHLLTVICDVVSAWALYIFFRPVHRQLAMLTALMRVVYAGFNIVALSSLVEAASIVRYDPEPIMHADEILHHVQAFGVQWRAGLIFFGVYLVVLGVLVWKAPYVPRLIGGFVVMAGVGYTSEHLRYFFLPGVDTSLLASIFVGEIVFVIWLLIWGARVREP